eukprot:TRINITY_DN8051_c0_g1_i4.p1 TRINITY_DN8051_c0_g1~~TRINITY_DN8051_c0_g1_i4.p1  ORF type:complete len:183 (+),score=42.24 TRINITY_DN8051_c0_g1_i4:67-615(+)
MCIRDRYQRRVHGADFSKGKPEGAYAYYSMIYENDRPEDRFVNYQFINSDVSDIKLLMPENVCQANGDKSLRCILQTQESVEVFRQMTFFTGVQNDEQTHEFALKNNQGNEVKVSFKADKEREFLILIKNNGDQATIIPQTNYAGKFRFRVAGQVKTDTPFLVHITIKLELGFLLQLSLIHI